LLQQGSAKTESSIHQYNGAYIETCRHGNNKAHARLFPASATVGRVSDSRARCRLMSRQSDPVVHDCRSCSAAAATGCHNAVPSWKIRRAAPLNPARRPRGAPRCTARGSRHPPRHALAPATAPRPLSIVSRRALREKRAEMGPSNTGPPGLCSASEVSRRSGIIPSSSGPGLLSLLHKIT